MVDDLSNSDLIEIIKRAGEQVQRREQRHRRLLVDGDSLPDGYGKADFDHATKQSYWSAEEFAAYSLDKDPLVINQKECGAWIKVHPFCGLFCKRLDVIHRAIQVGRLSQNPSPLEAVEWAVQCRMLLPNQLFESLNIHGHTVIDWTLACASLAEDYDRLMAAHEQMGQDHDATERELNQTLAAMRLQTEEWSDWSTVAMQSIEQLRNRVHEVETENRELRENNSILNDAQKSLHPKERNSLLKIAYIGARTGYGWVPGKRSSKIAEIAKDGVSLGVPIDEETVRKFLEQAHHAFGNNEEIGSDV